MFSLKHFLCLIITAFISVSIIIVNIMSLDITPVSEQIENMIIRGTAYSNSREYKLMALEYIRDSLNREKNNIYVLFDVLQFLAFEGTINTINAENIIYDFPDVRLEAVKLLGQFSINETKNVLLIVLKFENDPIVLHEAIRYMFLNWSDFYKNDDEINIIINAIEKITRLNR